MWFSSTLGRSMHPLDWPAAPPILDGTDVRLRAWTASDADAVFDACQDPEIQRWTTVPVPYLRSDAVGFVEGMASEQWAAGTGALFCISSPTDDRVLGSCGLVAVDQENLVAEVGYWVATDARGAGVAQRAVRLLSSWALTEGGVHRLELVSDVANAASAAVAERVGYTKEGVLRDRVLSRGTRVDMVLYALLTDTGVP